MEHQTHSHEHPSAELVYFFDKRILHPLPTSSCMDKYVSDIKGVASSHCRMRDQMRVHVHACEHTHGSTACLRIILVYVSAESIT